MSESNESQKPLDFDLRKRIWRTLEAHGLGWIDNGKPDAHCLCGHVPRLGESWHFHVADALIRELGLHEEQEPTGWGRDVTATRIVSEWKHQAGCKCQWCQQ